MKVKSVLGKFEKAKKALNRQCKGSLKKPFGPHDNGWAIIKIGKGIKSPLSEETLVFINRKKTGLHFPPPFQPPGFV